MIKMIKNVKKTKNDQKWSKWPSMIFFRFKIFLKSFWAFEVIFGVNIEVPDLSVVEVKITKSVISIFFSLNLKPVLLFLNANTKTICTLLKRSAW